MVAGWTSNPCEDSWTQAQANEPPCRCTDTKSQMQTNACTLCMAACMLTLFCSNIFQDSGNVRDGLLSARTTKETHHAHRDDTFFQQGRGFQSIDTHVTEVCTNAVHCRADPHCSGGASIGARPQHAVLAPTYRSASVLVLPFSPVARAIEEAWGR